MTMVSPLYEGAMFHSIGFTDCHDDSIYEALEEIRCIPGGQVLAVACWRYEVAQASVRKAMKLQTDGKDKSDYATDEDVERWETCVKLAKETRSIRSKELTEALNKLEYSETTDEPELKNEELFDLRDCVLEYLVKFVNYTVLKETYETTLEDAYEETGELHEWNNPILDEMTDDLRGIREIADEMVVMCVLTGWFF